MELKLESLFLFQIDSDAVSRKSFTYNVTFEPEANQKDVMEHSGMTKLVEMAMNG